MGLSGKAWLRVFAWALASTVLLAVLLWLGFYLRRGTLDENDKVASIVSMVASLASLTITAVGFTRELRRPQADLNDAARRLADAVQAQWDDEAARRSLHQPAPLPLHWWSSTEEVGDDPNVIAGGAVGGRVVRLRLHGELDEVADKFLALPHRRLVIVGPPGAGKTVLALELTRKLVARRKSGELQEVPVLLSLASWDPTVQLRTWAARQLTDTYAILRHPSYPPDVAQQLVTTRRVLLILDGLDEVPESQRAQAIKRLNIDADASWPLVVTCRSEDFKPAVVDEPLKAAAVVEVQPVNAQDAIEFLRVAPKPDCSWKEVVGHLRAHPDGELAKALSSPLMVSMARTVSAGPGRQPSQLVDLAKSGGRRAVERHLLDGFIPAAYGKRSTAVGQDTSASQRQWDPVSARRYLTFLATHLHRRDTQNLAWWQLPETVPNWPKTVPGPAPPWWVGTVVGVLGGIPAGLVGGLNQESGVGLGIGLLLGIPVGLRIRTLQRDSLRKRGLRGQALEDHGRIRRRSNLALAAGLLGGLVGGTLGASTRAAGWSGGIAGGFAIGFATGGLCGWVGGLLGGLAGGYAGEVFAGQGSGLPAGLLSGTGAALALGLVAGIAGHRDPAPGFGPPARLSVVRLLAGLLAGLVMGTAIGIAAWLRFGAVVGKIAGVTGFVVLGLVVMLSGTSAGLRVAVSPKSVLRLDRRTFWLFAFIGGVAGLLALFVGVSALVGAAAALVGALGLGFFQATWGRYTLARVYLAARGRLPWRLMAFLEDAHRRQVLRQVGRVYQFRHALLRDHLAPSESEPQTGDMRSGLEEPVGDDS